MFLTKSKKNKTNEPQLKNKNQGEGWVLLFKAIVTGAMLFLLWRGWDYTKPNNFPIRQVKIISSYEHIDQKLLQNITTSYIDNGFFYLNVIGMKQQLLKLPWVYVVSIRRKWPDTVIVNVVEQQAVLQWGADALVNHEGKVFTPPISTFPKGLPIIFGPVERELEIFTLYKKAAQYLEPLDLSIKQLSFNPQHYWEILLNVDTVVYLKENDPLNQLEFLIDLYRRITIDHKYPPKSIDLRYNNDGLAVSWE